MLIIINYMELQDYIITLFFYLNKIAKKFK